MTATTNTTHPAFVWGTEVDEEGTTVNVVHPAIDGETYYPENVFSTKAEAEAAIAAYEAE